MYDLGKVNHCEYFAGGVNDTYRLLADDKTYWLRVYRHGWRTDAEVGAEMEFLAAASRAGLSVCQAIPKQKDSALFDVLVAPEGLRQVALFRDANGRFADQEDKRHPESYGRVAAELHEFADEFSKGKVQPLDRFTIDGDHLVHSPLSWIKRIFPHRSAELAFLEETGSRILGLMAPMLVNCDFGLCHGDLHFGNVNFDAQDNPVVYDFDCMGFGYRAYDVCVFRWNEELSKLETSSDKWNLFLKGYTSVRNLSDADLNLIPYFMVLRHIWLLGLHTQGTRFWGRTWINDPYIEHHAGVIKGFMERYHI